MLASKIYSLLKKKETTISDQADPLKTDSHVICLGHFTNRDYVVSAHFDL